MTIQRVSKTDTLIEAFKTWDGAAWFRAHLAWLKGSYQSAQATLHYKGEETAKPEKVKQRPVINEEKQDSMWKWRVKNFGVRQAKKLERMYK
ncbi:hypothetical protein D3C87_1542520 [compost metagenome]